MSYIPSTDNKYETDFYGNVKEPKKINPYYEGLLPEKERSFLKEWDLIADTVKNFFNNISVFSDSFSDIAGFNIDAVDESVVTGDDEEAYKNANNETKLMATIAYCLENWIADERNVTVVSMIDDMDEKEHEKNMKMLENEEPF